MKRVSIAVLIIIFSVKVFAQDEFPLEWKTKFPVKSDYWRISEDRKWVGGFSDQAMAVIDGESGNVVWSATYADLTGEKVIEYQSWNPDLEEIVLSKPADKKATSYTRYIVDLKTGQLKNTLQEQSKYYEPKARVKTSRTVPMMSDRYEDDQIKIELNFARSMEVGAGITGRKEKRIGVKAMNPKGEILWTSGVDGYYSGSLCTAGIWEKVSNAADFGGDFVWATANDNYVFVIYEGISVLDRNTGKELWSMDTKTIDIDFKLVAVDQQIGVLPLPVIDSESSTIFWAKKDKSGTAIVALDMATGNTKWTYDDKLNSESLIRQIVLKENRLVVQVGGRIWTQRYVPGSNGGSECFQEIKFDEKGADVIVLEAGSGKLIWKASEKKEWKESLGSFFGDVLVKNSSLYINSSKSLLKVALENGELENKVALKDFKVGDVKNLEFSADDKIFLVGTEGLARVNEDGSLGWSANTGANFGSFGYSDAFFIYNSVSKSSGRPDGFVRVDLSSGKMYGKAGDIPYPYFTDDYESFFRYEKGEVFKYKTRP